MYLTYNDYSELNSFDSTVTPDLFAKYIGKASLVVDEITRDYYQLHDLATDKNTFRANKFREAIGLEINHLDELGTASSYEAGQEPSSISMGRTSINYGNQTQNINGAPLSALYSDEAISVLAGSGLLCRGVQSI
ncbi:hypothetical protein NVV78_06875 [Pediococcus ethanolidurans]|uniref:hypothetical protein n=1 Tax=Pediococcus ethanolidurans TaxID=319653 RepID=UPI0021E734D1|nr:hypothetical protein [Pediococcus ethanolidurans]MCV3315664.1 hypothetical protein [Pediococcus ethanolidurans]